MELNIEEEIRKVKEDLVKLNGNLDLIKQQEANTVKSIVMREGVLRYLTNQLSLLGLDSEV